MTFWGSLEIIPGAEEEGRTQIPRGHHSWGRARLPQGLLLLGTKTEENPDPSGTTTLGDKEREGPDTQWDGPSLLGTEGWVQTP